MHNGKQDDESGGRDQGCEDQAVKRRRTQAGARDFAEKRRDDAVKHRGKQQAGGQPEGAAVLKLGAAKEVAGYTGERRLRERDNCNADRADPKIDALVPTTYCTFSNVA